MALNHMNLPVTDPGGMRDFLVKYLGMTSKSSGPAKMALLSDESDMQLLLMGPEMASSAGTGFPKAFHVGFRQSSEDDVNRIYQQMKDDGVDVSPPAKAHGAWAFYLRTSWGVMIEVVA